MRTKNNAKELVNDLNTLPRPVELTFVRSKGNKRACELCDPACKAEGWGEGFPHNGKYEPRPCGCSTRELVHNRFPARKGWGLRDGYPLLVERARERVRYNDECYYAKPNMESGLPPHLTHFTHLRKRFAFTLAEVLITLAVIGIVAAMTIPNLVQSYQEKITVTKVKKMYSTLSQAYALYKVDNDVDETYVKNHDGAVKVFDIFQKNLKVSKICSGDEGCISDKYSRQNHDSYGGYTSESYYSVRLEDGSALTFRGGSAETLFQIYYDVNGKLPPNKWGTDFFQFNGYKDKIIPCCGVKSDSNLKVSCYDTGWGCTEWVVYNGNMDYLHCPDELSWDGKRKCSD